MSKFEIELDDAKEEGREEAIKQVLEMIRLERENNKRQIIYFKKRPESKETVLKLLNSNITLAELEGDIEDRFGIKNLQSGGDVNG